MSAASEQKADKWIVWLFKAAPRIPAEHDVLAELHAGTEQYLIDTLDLYGPALLQADISPREP